MNLQTTKWRLPAEWEPVEAVILAIPHPQTDWEPYLKDALECFGNIAAALTRSTEVIAVLPWEDYEPLKEAILSKIPSGNIDKVHFYHHTTNDTWARDIAPITLLGKDGQREYLDFGFNGWGNKFEAAKDNALTKALVSQWHLQGTHRDCTDFILEGGSIESDGAGTILTTSRCLLSPERNPQFTKEQITDKLKELLGAQQILWLDHGFMMGDDTDSHIDTLARLAPGNTILYTGAGDDPQDPHYQELRKMEAQLKTFRTLDGMPYNLIELPLPEPVYDPEETDFRLPATYANFLIANNQVLMPTYGQYQKDILAGQILQIVFPNHRITPIDCRVLVRQHGSLHCVTMQIPKAEKYT